MPHKSLDAIFKPRMDVGNAMARLRDLITTPVVSEKYGYSIRINESRLLPEEITRIGMFHRQKLNKAAITISVDENYELNDTGCYRIRRLEENLYQAYLPSDYPTENVITYQWNQSREDNFHGHFNFYYSITRDSVSKGSMLLYMILLLTVGVIGNAIYDAIQALMNNRCYLSCRKIFYTLLLRTESTLPMQPRQRRRSSTLGKRIPADMLLWTRISWSTSLPPACDQAGA